MAAGAVLLVDLFSLPRDVKTGQAGKDGHRRPQARRDFKHTQFAAHVLV
jgi:hypothetical protein